MPMRTESPGTAGYFGDPGLLCVSRLPPGWNRRGAPSEAAGRGVPKRRASGPALLDGALDPYRRYSQA